MRFCPDCGVGHECSEETGRERAEVELMRLQCERDVKVASINANAAKTIAETESENSAEHAEGVVEGVEAVLEAGEGGEPAEGEPIVVEAPSVDSEAIEDVSPDVDAPPVVEVTESSPKSRGGWWDSYR